MGRCGGSTAKPKKDVKLLDLPARTSKSGRDVSVKGGPTKAKTAKKPL